MKELNEIVLEKGFYFSGQLCLTKGHLGNQEGLQESEYPP